MDIPSVAAATREIDALTKRLEGFAKENEHLRQRCTGYRCRLEDMESEIRATLEQEEEARQEALDLRKRYDSLKKRYREAQSW